jgi:hypothetical protein
VWTASESVTGQAARCLVTLYLMEKRETIGLDGRAQQGLYVLTHVLAGELSADEAPEPQAVQQNRRGKEGLDERLIGTREEPGLPRPAGWLPDPPIVETVRHLVGADCSYLSPLSGGSAPR